VVSLQQAQTGNRVYGGVSQSPNRGQVSAFGAQGYIKRELRNKNRAGVVRQIGRDGKSDNRSTVASQALMRQRKKKFNNEGRPIIPAADTPIKPPPGQQPVTDGAGGGGIQVPTVQVTEDGILQLPYNQDLSVEQLGAFNNANDQLLGLKVEGDQQAQQYGASKRESQLAYESLGKQTLAKNASGGTAFSSMYGNAVANNATGFANQMSDLEMQNNNFLTNQGLQRSAIQSSLNQQLAALAQQYAHDLNTEAGGLGFGRAEGQTSNINKKADNPRRRQRRRNRGKKK
jgi:hypothetical protein